MRVLITGGPSGQLRHELLRTAPEHVTLCGIDEGTRALAGASRAAGALASAPASALASTGVSRARLDVTDADAVEAAVRRHAPDVIINAAAYTAVDRAESEPARARAVNVDGVCNLAEAAMRANARLVHVSTDFVFGPGDGTPFAEDARTAPLGVYGRTKLDGERALAAILPESGCVVRTAWVYSAHGNNFVKTMLRLMHERDELGVVADQIGSPTWARPLAVALWRAATLGTSGTLHWSGAGVASWYDLAVAVLEEGRALGLVENRPRIRPLRTEQYPTPAARPAYSVLETSRTREILDLPAVHWREELRAMLGELT